MQDHILTKKFADINLQDDFFESLRKDYNEFDDWFDRKKNEKAQVLYNKDGKVEAFLYIKKEEEQVTDVIPELPAMPRLKVGTFKVNPHGTRLGERFMKRILDIAIFAEVREIYVTVFPKHQALISLFLKYGFRKLGTKTTPSGIEDVLVKNLHVVSDDIYCDYPRFDLSGKKRLLSIYPDFHSRLFPDSILHNESYSIIKDIAHTNSVHKAYICRMKVGDLQLGDKVIIYRTSDGQGPAHYRSVATSVCVVEEVKAKDSFASEQEYVEYCRSYSVYTETELKEYYKDRRDSYVVRMLYNAALSKRITRKVLLDEVGLDPNQYWGYMPLSDEQFIKILKKGSSHEGLVIY